MSSNLTIIVALAILTVIDYFIIYGYSWKSVKIFRIFQLFCSAGCAREKIKKKLSKNYGE
jgi:hypothetical protein